MIKKISAKQTFNFSRIDDLILNLLLKITTCALVIISITACKSENNIQSQSKTLSISILHDNDLAIADWLGAARDQFKNEISSLMPDTNLEIKLLQESTTRSIETLANGKNKSEAILLPHSAFSDLMKGELRNLGAPLSSCKDLIGSPYVIIAPKKNASRLQAILGRPILDLAEPTVAIKLKELGLLLKNSNYGYTHPGRSARGQFSLLLSVAGANPNITDINTVWNNPLDSVIELQKNLEWYAPSDTQLLKRLVSKNTSLSNSNQNDLSLGLISLRQVQSREDLKDNIIIMMPSDATVWETHSLCISQADWVNPAKKSILQKFQAYLATANLLEAARDKGFSAIDVDNKQTPPAIPFSASKSELSGKYVESLKKPLSISFAMDTSSTMLPETIGYLKDFAQLLIATTPSNYNVELVKFSTEISLLGSKTSLSGNIENKLSQLIPNGGSSIYDAIAKQYELLSKYPISTTRRVALLVTDGNDKTSQRSVDDIVELVSDARRSNGFISLHIVVISPASVDIEPIKRIVDAANGTLYETESDQLAQLLAELEKTL